MKRGGLAISAQGFTIVETLIVLAVTGILFVSAALMINGKQSRTDFQVGVRNLQQRLQQIINQTASGYYPNNGDFRCTVTGLIGSPLRISSVDPTGQGQNQDCIFAGTAVVFGGPGSADKYGVYPLAGQRTYGGVDVTTPTQARLTAVAQGTTTNTDAPRVDRVVLPNGLTYVGSNIQHGVFAVAFLSTFGKFQGPSSDSMGGSQQLKLSTYHLPWDLASDVENINNEAINGGLFQYPTPSTSVDLCFDSGGTKQSVIISIDVGLNVTTSIKTGVTGVNCP